MQAKFGTTKKDRIG